MPQIEVECSVCGTTTTTGVFVSEQTFESKTWEWERTECDSCGRKTKWDEADVVNF